MIKEIAFKVDTGKNIYTKTWKVKRESVNLFQNNKKPERYLEKFLSNLQVAKHKECGIWLDKVKITSEIKIKKVQTSHGITKLTRTYRKQDKPRRIK